MNKEDLLSALFFETFNKKKSIRFILKGLSMYPVLREDDILTVKPISFYEAEAGDILAYQNISTKKITVHRMVKREIRDNKSVIFTSGEASGYFIYDQPLAPDKYLVAKVITIERGIKERIDLTAPGNILKAKIHTYVLAYFHILIRIQRKIYRIINKLFR